jgi:hypothetical protein
MKLLGRAVCPLQFFAVFSGWSVHAYRFQSLPQFRENSDPRSQVSLFGSASLEALRSKWVESSSSTQNFMV